MALEIDNTALEFYEIMQWYENQPDDEDPYGYYRKPFTQETDNIEDIAFYFYESIFRNREYMTPYYKKLLEKRIRGMRYLNEHLTEALLSGEPLVRRLAEIIYNDTRQIPSS